MKPPCYSAADNSVCSCNFQPSKGVGVTICGTFCPNNVAKNCLETSEYKKIVRRPRTTLGDLHGSNRLSVWRGGGRLPPPQEPYPRYRRFGSESLALRTSITRRDSLDRLALFQQLAHWVERCLSSVHSTQTKLN